MGKKLHGITVVLYDKQKTGEDGFGRPIYTDVSINVEDVIVGEPSAQEITDTLNLTGKRLAYTLGIPKGDTHTWTDRKVGFFGEVFHVFGKPSQGIEDMIPLDWNKKVQVERFE
jgi:hypothetical protein